MKRYGKFFIVLLTIVSTKTILVKRGAKVWSRDIFTMSMPFASNTVCREKYFGSYLTESSCDCDLYKLHTVLSTDGGKFKCSAGCTDTAKSNIINRTPYTLKLNAALPCFPVIKKILLWNLYTNMTGVWHDLTHTASKYIYVINRDVLYVSSHIDFKLWSGQVFKIVFGCPNEFCRVVKVPGNIIYPFDMLTLFPRTTVAPTPDKISTTQKQTTTIHTSTTNKPTQTDAITKTTTSYQSIVLTQPHTSLDNLTTRTTSPKDEGIDQYIVIALIAAGVVLVAAIVSVLCLRRSSLIKKSKKVDAEKRNSVFYINDPKTPNQHAASLDKSQEIIEHYHQRAQEPKPSKNAKASYLNKGLEDDSIPNPVLSGNELITRKRIETESSNTSSAYFSINDYNSLEYYPKNKYAGLASITEHPSSVATRNDFQTNRISINEPIYKEIYIDGTCQRSDNKTNSHNYQTLQGVIIPDIYQRLYNPHYTALSADTDNEPYSYALLNVKRETTHTAGNRV